MVMGTDGPYPEKVGPRFRYWAGHRAWVLSIVFDIAFLNKKIYFKIIF